MVDIFYFVLAKKGNEIHSPSIVMTILMPFSSLVDVVIYSSAWCECGGLCWQPPQYRDWYTPAGGEGGICGRIVWEQMMCLVSHHCS